MLAREQMQILRRRGWREDGREVGWQRVLLHLLLIVDDDVGILTAVKSRCLIF